MVEIADAPMWLVDLFEKPVTAAREAPEGVELDLPYSVDEARKWLARQTPATEGSASDQLYRYAAHLKDMAISAPLAVELLHEYNPAYAIDDIAVRVANAFNYGQNQPGSDRPRDDAEVFAAVQPPVGVIIEPHPNHFKTRAQSRDEPAPVYLIDCLLQEDSDAALIGPSGHLKSFVALDLAFAVATGTDALGQFKVKQGPVLYFAGEGARSLKKKRATAWETAHGYEAFSVEDIFIADIVPAIGNPQLIAQLVADAKTMLDDRSPALFVNDTLNRSLNGEDEDSAATAARYLNTIAAIRRELGGGASLTLHHSGYSDAKRGRGSSAFGAGWDTELNIETHTQSELDGHHEITVTVTKQKDDDGGQSFSLRSRTVSIPDGASLVLEPIIGAPAMKQTTGEQRDRVFRFVIAELDREQYIKETNRGGHPGPRYVARQLELPERTVENALVDLVALKWLEYHERSGSYGIDRAGAGYRKGSEFGCADARKALIEPVSAPVVDVTEPVIW